MGRKRKASGKFTLALPRSQEKTGATSGGRAMHGDERGQRAHSRVCPPHTPSGEPQVGSPSHAQPPTAVSTAAQPSLGPEAITSVTPAPLPAGLITPAAILPDWLLAHQPSASVTERTAGAGSLHPQVPRRHLREVTMACFIAYVEK